MPPAVISVASGKGGVGKTTSVANISIALARQGLNVLAWDLDGQGNLGQAFGIDLAHVGLTSYHLLSGRLDTIGPAIRTTQFEGVSLIPSQMELFAAEQELTGGVGKEFIVRTLVQQDEAQAFDVILLDLPPSLGFHTVNGFAASRWVLIPLQVSGFALSGLRQLAYAIRLAQEHLNPELELLGLVPTFVSPRTNFSQDLLEAIHLIPQTRVFQPYIPNTVRVAEGSLSGEPVVSSAPGNVAAKAYVTIAAEIWDVVRSSPAHISRAPTPSISAPARAEELPPGRPVSAPQAQPRTVAAPAAEPKPEPETKRRFFGWWRRSSRPAS